jgi:hypothetical protein
MGRFLAKADLAIPEVRNLLSIYHFSSMITRSAVFKNIGSAVEKEKSRGRVEVIKDYMSG